MAEHNETGKKGEQAAAEYLGKKGYLILEVNWSYKGMEADIIASHNNLLVVVEVKTRSGYIIGEQGDWVNRQKQRNVIRAAQYYVNYKQIDMEVRFDIITVIFYGESFQVSHTEDAFFPLV